MKSIEIKNRRDFIIVEKTDGKNILSGSQLFCGVCGNSLGEAIENIQFPFNSISLQKKLKDKTFRHGAMGSLYHTTCGHSMFNMCCGCGWKFISMKNYFTEMLLKEIEENVQSE